MIRKYFYGVSDEEEVGIIKETGIQGKAICAGADNRPSNPAKGLDLLPTDDISETEWRFPHVAANHER